MKLPTSYSWVSTSDFCIAHCDVLSSSLFGGATLSSTWQDSTWIHTVLLLQFQFLQGFYNHFYYLYGFIRFLCSNLGQSLSVYTGGLITELCSEPDSLWQSMLICYTFSFMFHQLFEKVSEASFTFSLHLIKPLIIHLIFSPPHIRHHLTRHIYPFIVKNMCLC